MQRIASIVAIIFNFLSLRMTFWTVPFEPQKRFFKPQVFFRFEMGRSLAFFGAMANPVLSSLRNRQRFRCWHSRRCRSRYRRCGRCRRRRRLCCEVTLRSRTEEANNIFELWNFCFTACKINASFSSLFCSFSHQRNASVLFFSLMNFFSSWSQLYMSAPNVGATCSILYADILFWLLLNCPLV